MDKHTFDNLQPGDIVRHISGKDAYIVTGNYGDHLTVVRTMDISNPIEWELLFRNSALQPEYIIDPADWKFAKGNE